MLNESKHLKDTNKYYFTVLSEKGIVPTSSHQVIYLISSFLPKYTHIRFLYSSKYYIGIQFLLGLLHENMFHLRLLRMMI